MSFPRIAAAVVVLSALWSVGVEVSRAESNDLVVISDELERLRQDVIDLQREIYRDGATASGARLEIDAPSRAEVVSRNAEFDLRLAAVDEEIRKMTGLIEELEHTINNVGRRLDKLVADVDFRLISLEETVKASVQPAELTTSSLSEQEGTEKETVRPESLQVTAALPEGTPAQRYDFAFGLLRSGRYDDAEQAFKSFVLEHPDDRLAGNAQYWLGETHYVRASYEQAATAFLDGYQNYPDSSKAPDNLLKLGMTLHALGQRAEACVTLQELQSKFPSAVQPIRDRASREMRMLNCP